MKDFYIRNATKNDLTLIAEAEKLCFTDPWSEKALGETLASPATRFLAAFGENGEAEEVLLGYGICYVLPGETEILNLAVLPGARRRGIGSALLSALIPETDNSETVLYLDVRSSNSAAIALYEKEGFVRVGVRKRYYSHPTEDAIEMQKLVKKE